MAKKILKIRDKDIEVETVLEKEGRFFLLTAECEGAAAERTWTPGPEDGKRPEYTLEQLQRDLDANRQAVAEEAEYRARVRKMMGEVS